MALAREVGGGGGAAGNMHLLKGPLSNLPSTRGSGLGLSHS